VRVRSPPRARTCEPFCPSHRCLDRRRPFVAPESARYGAGVSSDGPDRHQPAAGSAAQAVSGSTVGFLAGDWTLIRRIRDHRTGQIGTFCGTASFRPCRAEQAEPPLLAYTESGELQFGSHRGPASRSLLVRDLPDGTADVRFADGREFFRLDLRSGSCAAAHPCRADRYDVTVTRLSADSYAETWRVAGPAKDYELSTTYIRAETSESTAGEPR
jgi:Family of unknown function (DUF6314)